MAFYGLDSHAEYPALIVSQFDWPFSFRSLAKKSSFKIDNKDEQLTILAILFIRGVLGFDLAL